MKLTQPRGVASWKGSMSGFNLTSCDWATKVEHGCGGQLRRLQSLAQCAQKDWSNTPWVCLLRGPRSAAPESRRHVAGWSPRHQREHSGSTVARVVIAALARSVARASPCLQQTEHVGCWSSTTCLASNKRSLTTGRCGLNLEIEKYRLYQLLQSDLLGGPK